MQQSFIIQQIAYSDIVITSRSGQSTFSMRFEVGRVYRSVVVVPRYEEGSSFHDDQMRGPSASRLEMGPSRDDGLERSRLIC